MISELKLWQMACANPKGSLILFLEMPISSIEERKLDLLTIYLS